MKIDYLHTHVWVLAMLKPVGMHLYLSFSVNYHSLCGATYRGNLCYCDFCISLIFQNDTLESLKASSVAILQICFFCVNVRACSSFMLYFLPVSEHFRICIAEVNLCRMATPLLKTHKNQLQFLPSYIETALTIWKSNNLMSLHHVLLPCYLTQAHVKHRTFLLPH